MRALLCGLAAAAFISAVSALAQDATLIQIKWDKNAFQASPWKGNGDEVGWLIFRNARGKSPLMDTEGLLKECAAEPAHSSTPVLMVRSNTYLVPNTFDESRRMPDYVKKQHQDANWKRQESELVAQLIRACDANHIRLIVNTSMDLKGPWKILAGPK